MKNSRNKMQIFIPPLLFILCVFSFSQSMEDKEALSITNNPDIRESKFLLFSEKLKKEFQLENSTTLKINPDMESLLINIRHMQNIKLELFAMDGRRISTQNSGLLNRGLHRFFVRGFPIPNQKSGMLILRITLDSGVHQFYYNKFSRKVTPLYSV